MILKFRFGPARINCEAERFPKEWFSDFRGPYYRPFEVSDQGVPDLAIRVHTGSLPPRERESAEPVAELPSNWRLFLAEGGYRLEIFSQVRSQLRTVVRMDEAMRRADLYVASPDWFLGDLTMPFVQWWLTGWLAERRKGMILHATALSLEGKTFVCFGPSGAGKTTLARWCRDEGGACILSDERIILWDDGEDWCVAGTPWPGELRAVSAATARVTRLAVLVKAESNQWIPVPPMKFLPLLISEAFLPVWSRERMEGFMEAAQRVAGRVPVGELRFRSDPSIVSYLNSMFRSREVHA